MSASLPTPAAQYLRMSTDQQRLSLAYQAVAIQRYAEAHGFKIVQSYEDRGRSGLTLKHREGLARLLQDVVSGDQVYKAVLVYDVSRWGRFQDTDESAHYEFLCKSAGVPIYYCAESFKNNSSSPAVIMKTLKRVMAAEYSRDLSQRLSRTKKILTQRGYRAGGIAGYGLRRMLVSFDGSTKQVLHRGEVKNFASGRVILVPGPPREVARVRDIYRLKISERKSAKAIARDFIRKGLRCNCERWTYERILVSDHFTVRCLPGLASALDENAKTDLRLALSYDAAGSFDFCVPQPPAQYIHYQVLVVGSLLHAPLCLASVSSHFHIAFAHA